ncbi:DUF4397 domain-containing protein [Corallincola spongiicola]|uniref:DUF4397 domain-containing protein n=2 Tax=Corallincola spongiicola TaxID=2520508 RepID=A0ABY1WQ48_9GAMM|nr:DUF4397 domain-containing protein [Corallincola spongiicola]
MEKNIMKLTKSVLALLISSALISGCSDDDDDEEIIVPDGEAFVRVVHASPDAPNVNVYVDDAQVLADVSYQQASAFLALPEGTYDIRVEAIVPGGNVDVFQGDVSVDALLQYNIVAVGYAAGLLEPTALDSTTFQPVIVPRDGIYDETMLRLQVLHGAPDVGLVGVHVTGPDDELSDATELTELDYGDFTMDPVMVAPAVYRVRLTDPDDASVVAYDSGPLDLSAGGDLFITATSNTGAGAAPVNLLVMDGTADENGNDAGVVADANLAAEVRITHAINNVGGVDVWVNGTAPEMGSPLYNLMFPSTTPMEGYLELPAASYDFDVALTGTMDVAISAEDVMLAGGSRYNVFAIPQGPGDVNPALWPIVIDDRAVATESKLRVLHISPEAGNVDIYLSADDMIDADDTVLADIPYLGDSGNISVVPGMYYLMVTPTGDMDTIALGPLALDLMAGKVYTAAAVTDPMNETGVAIEGIDVGLIGLDDLMIAPGDPLVRVSHASPDAPAVNVLVDGAVALEGVDYKVASGLIELPAGAHTVQIDALDADGDFLATVLPETSLDLMAGYTYNVSAIGYAAELGMETATAFAPSIVASPTRALAADKVRVQILHGAPNAPQVDIHVTAPDATLSADTVLTTLAFAEYTMSPVTVPTGDYQIRITPADDLTVVYDSGTLALAGGSDLFITAIQNTDAGDKLVALEVLDGSVDEEGNDAAIVYDKDTGADVNVIHTVAAAPLVDVYVDDALAVDDFAFQATTGYVPLAAGMHTLDVTASDAADNSMPVITADVDLMASYSYSVLAIGDGSDEKPLALWPLVDMPRSIATEAMLRFAHAATAAPLVDIYLSADATLDAGDALLVEDLDYMETASLSVNADTGGYVFVAVADTSTPAIGPIMIQADLGGVYTVVAIDDGMSGFTVIDVDGIAVPE